jgi:hypothetical protein
MDRDKEQVCAEHDLTGLKVLATCQHSGPASFNSCAIIECGSTASAVVQVYHRQCDRRGKAQEGISTWG